MAKMETKVENIETDVGEIKTSLNDFINSADKKYASKRIEKAFWYVLGAMVTAGLSLVVAGLIYVATGGLK